MIHVAYRLWGGDGFYAKMMGTSMLSMFENTNEKVTVHVMHNERLTPDNRGKFCYIAGQYGQQVEFHNVEEIAGTTLKKFDAVHPIKSGVNASWYPLIVHEVFPNLDKLIFLGADTIINLDIGEMWAYDLDKEGYGIGAVPESCNNLPKTFFRVIVDGYVRYEDYFNVDVMLLRPSFFKDNFNLILKGLEFVQQKRVSSNYKHYLANEQDTLSYLFSKNYLKLPGKFNVIIKWRREFNQIKSPNLENVIYHFADLSSKPDMNTDDVYNKLYLEYFMKTPWANADMFGNIDKAVVKTVEQIFNESKNILLHVTNLLGSRRRAFFVDKVFLEPARKIFAINADELVMDLSTGAENLIRAMNANRGKILLFILAGNYPQIRDFLTGQNFVEGMDFINGFMFLSERHGFKLNFDTRQICSEM